MRPRPARRRVQPWAHQVIPTGDSPQRNLFGPLRKIMALLVGAALFTALAVWLLADAKIDCLTTLHTICNDDETTALQSRFHNRFTVLRSNSDQELSEFQKQFPDWQDLNVFLSWSGRSTVRLTRSESLATVRIGESVQEVLSNGQLRPGESSTILIQFASSEAWQSWLESYSAPEDGLQALKTFSHDLQTLRPRATSVTVRNKDEVELRLENSSRAMIHLHSAGEVQQQLRTLQAVFTSSTMEQQPGEVDVRFKNVITR